VKGPPMSSETQDGSRKGTDGNGDDGRLTVPPMQRIACGSPSCRYNIEVLSERFVSIDSSADWDNLPPELKWSKTAAFPEPPAVGTRVHVRFNRLGVGTVQGYFVEHGWLGVHVLPDARPQWHIDQNGLEKNYYLVFGNEIAPVVAATLPEGGAA